MLSGVDSCLSRTCTGTEASYQQWGTSSSGNRNLTTGKLHQAVFTLMAERSTLNSGARISCGLGLFLEEYAGVAEIAHPGATVGYLA